MIKNKMSHVFSFLFVLMLVLLLFQPFVHACDGENRGTPKLEKLTIVSSGEPHEFNIAIADTEENQALGLMNRESLPDNEGMLFYFGDEKVRVFWMKNTLVSLDMLFIAPDGHINQIHHRAVPLDETRIVSQKPAFAVLEIKGGVAQKLALKPGDIIHHKVFGNPLAQ